MTSEESPLLSALELKIPPPVVALLVGTTMWLAAPLGPALDVPAPLRAGLAIAIALVGAGFDVAGALGFRRARTTVNPMQPAKTSALVTSGIYRVSRNPMYVGLLCILAGWAVYLASLWPLAGPALFVLYIGRFQIAPEERALAARFGAEFAAYSAKVRRWL